MSDDRENRRFPRYAHPAIPVRITVPAFSIAQLAPREVSLEGFMVAEIPKRPEIGSLADCTLEIEAQAFDGCQVRVVWMMENGTTDDTTWSVGLSLRKPEGREVKIDAALKEVFHRLGDPS